MALIPLAAASTFILPAVIPAVALAASELAGPLLALDEAVDFLVDGATKVMHYVGKSLSAATDTLRARVADATCPLFQNETATLPTCPLTRKKISIIARIALDGGHGDLSACVKLHDYLAHTHEEYALELIIDKTSEKALAIFESHTPRTVRFLDFASSLQDPSDTNLIIEYPFNVAGEMIKELFKTQSHDKRHLSRKDYFKKHPVSVDLNSIFRIHTPTLAIKEYGLSHPLDRDPSQGKMKMSTKVGALGVGGDSLGMLFDQELYTHFKTTRMQPPSAALLALHELQASEQKALLGALYSDQVIQDFHATYNLYFGYSRSSAAKGAFCDIISHLPQKEKTPYVILADEFIINPADFSIFGSKTELTARDIQFLPSFIGEFVKQGIHEVIFTWVTQGVPSERTIQLQKPASRRTRKNSFRILSFDRLSQTSMQAFIKASKREMLTTGDQSLSEALSHGKFPIYELRKHKLLFAESLVAHASLYNAALHAPATALFSTLNLNDTTFSSYQPAPYFEPRLNLQIVEALTALHRKTTLWNQYIDNLYETNNGFQKIDRFIQTML